MTHIDADRLAELFAAIDTTFFEPHPMTGDEAERIAAFHSDGDFYQVLAAGGGYVAYGMVRGLDAGYKVPSLGVAVRRDAYGHGHGRTMMLALESTAYDRGVRMMRLRVHPENVFAKRLYESLDYTLVAIERGEEVMVKNLKGFRDTLPEETNVEAWRRT